MRGVLEVLGESDLVRWIALGHNDTYGTKITLDDFYCEYNSVI